MMLYYKCREMRKHYADKKCDAFYAGLQFPAWKLTHLL